MREESMARGHNARKQMRKNNFLWSHCTKLIAGILFPRCSSKTAFPCPFSFSDPCFISSQQYGIILSWTGMKNNCVWRPLSKDSLFEFLPLDANTSAVPTVTSRAHQERKAGSQLRCCRCHCSLLGSRERPVQANLPLWTAQRLGRLQSEILLLCGTSIATSTAHPSFLQAVISFRRQNHAIFSSQQPLYKDKLKSEFLLPMSGFTDYLWQWKIKNTHGFSSGCSPWLGTALHSHHVPTSLPVSESPLCHVSHAVPGQLLGGLSVSGSLPPRPKRRVTLVLGLWPKFKTEIANLILDCWFQCSDFRFLPQVCLLSLFCLIFILVKNSQHFTAFIDYTFELEMKRLANKSSRTYFCTECTARTYF